MRGREREREEDLDFLLWAVSKSNLADDHIVSDSISLFRHGVRCPRWLPVEQDLKFLFVTKVVVIVNAARSLRVLATTEITVFTYREHVNCMAQK